jgi:hypothetical protein
MRLRNTVIKISLNQSETVVLFRTNQSEAGQVQVQQTGGGFTLGNLFRWPM